MVPSPGTRRLPLGCPRGYPNPDARGMLHGDAAPMGLPKQSVGGRGGDAVEGVGALEDRGS